MTARASIGRRLGIAAIMLVATLAAADFAVWAFACRQLQRGLDDAVAQAAAQGWQLQYGPSRRAGWPFAAELELPAPVVTAATPEIPGGGTWSAEQATLRWDPLDRNNLHILLSGNQHLRLGRLPPLDFHARTLGITAALDGSRPLAIAGADAEATLPAGHVTLRSIDAELTPSVLRLHLTQVRIDGITRQTLGSDLDTLELRAVLTSPVFTSPLPPGATPAERAAAWRQSGGTLDLPELAWQAGAFTGSGHATLRLDAQLQPDVDATIRVAGFAQPLDALTGSGLIPPRTATSAKAVLSLLAAPSGGTALDLPLRIEGGVLIAARFPLLRLPALDWGAQ